jgi:hypothetical protein
MKRIVLLILESVSAAGEQPHPVTAAAVDQSGWSTADIVTVDYDLHGPAPPTGSLRLQQAARSAAPPSAAAVPAPVGWELTPATFVRRTMTPDGIAERAHN